MINAGRGIDIPALRWWRAVRLLGTSLTAMSGADDRALFAQACGFVPAGHLALWLGAHGGLGLPAQPRFYAFAQCRWRSLWPARRWTSRCWSEQVGGVREITPGIICASAVGGSSAAAGVEQNLSKQARHWLALGRAPRGCSRQLKQRTETAQPPSTRSSRSCATTGTISRRAQATRAKRRLYSRLLNLLHRTRRQPGNGRSTSEGARWASWL